MSKNFLMPYIWDFLVDKIAELENTEFGDEGSLFPAIFEDNGSRYLYVFTSVNAMPEGFQQEYATMGHTINYIYAFICAIEKVLEKEIMLIIDPFCCKSEEVHTKEQVQDLL